jgi:hypothetical protein
MVTLLGQYNDDDGTERLYNQMTFDTYYSTSSDTVPPAILHTDGVLDAVHTRGALKVEATDGSGVRRVVVAYTDGQGAWNSQDLVYDAAALKWVGAITGTLETRYFVQVVDGAGNVSVDDNKGQYHLLAPSVRLIPTSSTLVYLPLVVRGG